MKLLRLFNSQQIRVAAAGSLVIKFLSAFFAFLNSVLLARILGLEQFGIYTLALATIILLTVPVSFGLPHLVIRYFSKYEVDKDYGSIKGLLKRANQFVILATLVAYAIAAITYVVWWHSYNELLVSAVLAGLVMLPLIVMASIRAAALRGLRFVVLGQISDTVLRSGLLCLGLLIYYILELDLTPAKALMLHGGAAAVALLAGIYFLHIKLRAPLKGVPAVYHNRFWLKETVPFAINGGVHIAKEKIISYVLAIFSSVEAVAVFDIALRASALVSFTLDAVNSAIAPYISKAYETGNKESLQRILRKSSRIIFAAAVPIVLVFIFAGEWFLGFVFGEEYRLSYIPLIILCVGQLVNSAAGSVGIVMYMTGQQAYFTKVVLTLTSLFALLSIPFVMFWDVNGAAIVLSLLLIVQNIVLVIFVKRQLQVNSTIF